MRSRAIFSSDFDSRKLSRENGVVNLFHISVSLADHDGTGHIGVITVDNCAVVHGQEALFKLHRTRNTVRSCGCCAGNRDGVERRLFAAVLLHIVFKLCRNFNFGHIVCENLADVFECALCNFLCGQDVLYFVIGFNASKVGKKTTDRRKLNSHTVKIALKSLKSGASQTSVFVADNLYSVVSCNFLEGRLAGQANCAKLGSFSTCRFNVTGVCVKMCVFFCYKL